MQWAADPQHRSDLFDASGSTRTPASDTITGFPGVEGVIEGRVRVIATAEEGEQLQPGEVLVTMVTNVGWTPLFPRHTGDWVRVDGKQGTVELLKAANAA